MIKILFTFYRILVPKPLRTIILKKTLRKKILEYFSLSETNEEQKEVIRYLENNEVRIFPYSFHSEYSPEKIEVFFDGERKMRYVLQDGRRLYFKKNWKENKIRKSYCDLMREQDIRSPHRYLSETFEIGNQDILADIGAAEGNFSLSVVEKVRKIYLFEYDKEWNEALKATFEPWKDKVEIVNKYAAGKNDDRHTRLDTFFENREKATFLKIDVDGSETDVLDSCKGLFDSDIPLRIALCTYHKNNDEECFSSLLRDNGFSVRPSQGYMINYYDKKIRAPYLRRGLIRAWR